LVAYKIWQNLPGAFFVVSVLQKDERYEYLFRFQFFSRSLVFQKRIICSTYSVMMFAVVLVVAEVVVAHGCDVITVNVTQYSVDCANSLGYRDKKNIIN
jgi:hypothetical protein